jgi:hypothetical protein
MGRAMNSYWRDLVHRQNAGRPPNQRCIDWFTARGVPATTLAFSPAGDLDLLLQDRIEWGDDGATFDFSDDGDDVLTFLVRDRFGHVQDIVAWSPKSDCVATWTGRASMIGADQLDAMQPDAAGLLVCETVLQWLQARRMGVVILDPKRALPSLLLNRPLLASSLDHGRTLRGALECALPPVLVPKESEAA